MPRLNLLNIRKWMAVAIAVVAVFGAGYFLGRQGFNAEFSRKSLVTISRETPPNKENVDFSLFWSVWDKVSSTYYDKSKIDPADMVYGAISGMVSSLGDPYTVFLPPTENKVVSEDLSGSFEGVGIQIGYKGTQLAVIAPLPGSPAEKAGVKAGDFIVGIKDEKKKIDTSTVGMGLAEAVADIRGPAGTKVTLMLLRDESPQAITVDIVREKLTVPSVVVSYRGDGNKIALIKLVNFGSETDAEWQSAINEVTAKGNIKGAVLDLRNNPGGYLQGAVDIAGEFLKENSVVVIEEKANGEDTQYRTDRVGKLTEMPLVVLINGGSASASEILAGALRDDRHIKLIGETSFGKGTIQEPEDLQGGAGLHITIARWLTPSRFWVNGKGLKPDVEVKSDETGKTDPQLEEAIKLLQ